jgi:hypothetical protein
MQVREAVTSLAASVDGNEFVLSAISLPTTLTAGQEIGPGAILFVVHTWFADKKGEEVIRLISARTATSKERKHYEEAYKKPEPSNRRRGREKGRRH